MGYKTASELLDELDGRSSALEIRTSSSSDELGGVIFICRCVCIPMARGEEGPTRTPTDRGKNKRRKMMRAGWDVGNMVVTYMHAGCARRIRCFCHCLIVLFPRRLRGRKERLPSPQYVSWAARLDVASRSCARTEICLSAPPRFSSFYLLSSYRSRDTFDEHTQNGLFGLTQQSWSFVKDITPGMPLFLYNLSEKRFHGVFEAVSWRRASR